MNNKFFSILILVIASTLVSCEKDKKAPPVDENGLTEDVRNIIPDDVLEKIKELGTVINGGNKPPIIEGEYLVSPLIISASNFSENLSSFGRMNMNLTFSNQNNTDLSVVVDYQKNYFDRGRSLTGTGLGAFITGEGNKFSAFFVVDGTSVSGYYKSVEVISGEISADGIKNWQRAYIMVEDNPSTIKKGQGRLNIDDDNLVERVD